MRHASMIAGGAFLLLLAACSAASPTPTSTPPPPEPTATSARAQLKQYAAHPGDIVETGKTYQAVLQTNKGDITIGLFPEEAPLTVSNFIFLAREGFYDGVPFHRVIEGFMIQSGDPTGTGSGGPGYTFLDEPVNRDYDRGIIAMANAGPNTNGSQFFIMHQDGGLPKLYTIFGEVTSGLEAVDAIATSPVTSTSRGELSKPTGDLHIESVQIIESET